MHGDIIYELIRVIFLLNNTWCCALDTSKLKISTLISMNRKGDSLLPLTIEQDI